MKKSELFEMASAACLDVLKRNQDLTNQRVKEMFSGGDENKKLSLDEAISKATALSLILAPEISAAVTAELLVRLGVVEIEDAE